MEYQLDKGCHVEEVAKHFKVRKQETDKDHILFSERPTLTLSKFVNSLKSVTSRKLRKEFPDVMKRELWGGKKRYVQSQGRD